MGRRRRHGAIYGAESLGRHGTTGVVAAPDSASARRKSPSRPRREERGGSDSWAQAVSGQREMRGSAGATCGWAGAARGKSRLGLALRKGRWASARLERGRKSDGLEKKWAARGGMTTARNRKEKGDLFFLLLFF